MFRHLRPQRVFRLRYPVCVDSSTLPRQGWWAIHFLQPQGPENLQSRNHPGQRFYRRVTLLAALQPLGHPCYGLAEKRNCRLRTVQTPPAPHCRSIGQPIRRFQLGQRLLPGTQLRQTPPQRLAAGQQTEMRVRKRKQRQKCERRPALRAQAPPNPDPLVIFVMCLLPPPPVADDRILFADRASA